MPGHLKILIAGATGYLGRYVTREFKRRGYFVRVLVRNPNKLRKEGKFLAPKIDEFVDEFHIGDVTKPDTLKGVAKGMDVVFSSVGMTRPERGKNFQEVDYKGNLNLLREALKEGVKLFIYVSVFKGPNFKWVQGVRAHEDFVEELKKAEADFRVIRPTGFFSDMAQFFNMAKQGFVIIIGSGKNHINPIHGEDLAEFIANSIESKEKEFNVGGPEVFSFDEIAELALRVLGKKRRILHISSRVVGTAGSFLGLFGKIYKDMTDFVKALSMDDFVAPQYGRHRLEDFYSELKTR